MEDELSLMEEKGKEATEERKQHLYNRVDELKRSNAALLAEIDLFERFIGRIDPQDLVSEVGEQQTGASQLEGGGREQRQRSPSNLSDCLQELTLEQKLYIAQREVTEMRENQKKLIQRYMGTQDNYKASMKEAKVRLAEIRKAQDEFERTLLKPVKEEMRMKEPLKVLQYIQDKSKVSKVDKFNQKNQALKAQEKKLQWQLQQKKKMGKAKYEEIFQEYNEQRIDKNLDGLQRNNLKAQHVLSLHKDKLNSVMLESRELSNDIFNRKQILAKIEERMEQAEEEQLKAKALNHHLRQQMADYQAPDISEYIHVKDKHKKLRQSIHTWERKAAVAEMALKTHSKAWNTQRTTLTPANSADAGARAGQQRIPIKLPYIYP